MLAEYAYDAWGKVTEITGNTVLAEQNPIRYRSYYFDFETEWYFLNTRYYSPDMCRFINADGYVQTGQSVLDKNMFSYCGNNSINRIDTNGQFWGAVVAVGLLVGVLALTLSGCSAKKSAKPSPPSNYVNSRSTNQNCYSYAFNLPSAANPGDYSAKNKSKRMYYNKKAYTPKEITDFIMRDMKSLNKPVRIVDSPLDKNENEYIVAMKTSSIVLEDIGVADYHFAVQLSDGTWADKPGQTPSRWNVLDGTALTWDLGYIENYYNTESVYFAVEK